MRYLLVSADQPSIKKVIDIPDRLVQKERQTLKKSNVKTKRLERVKPKKAHTKQPGPINKPNQTSKSVIPKNGSIHHRHQRKLPK